MFIYNFVIYILLLLSSANVMANNEINKEYIFIVDSKDIALKTIVDCKTKPCDSIDIEEVDNSDLKVSEYSNNLNVYYNMNRIFYSKFKRAINCFKDKCKVLLLSNLFMQDQINNALQKDYAKANNIIVDEISPNQEHELLFNDLIKVKNPNIKHLIILDIKDRAFYFSAGDKKMSTFLVNQGDIYNNIYLKVKDYVSNAKPFNFQNIFKLSNEIIMHLKLDNIYTLYSLKNFEADKKMSIIMNNREINKYFVNELISKRLKKINIINRISLAYIEISKLKGDENKIEEKLKELSSLLYTYSLIKFFKVEAVDLYSNQDLQAIIK